MFVMTVPLAVAVYAAPASAAPAQHEHVSATLDANGVGPAVLTGAINDSGTFTTLSEHQSGKSHVSHGTFRIDTATGSIAGKFVSLQTSDKVDATTCTETQKSKGTDVLDKKAGTGAYAGVKGTGHFTSVTTITGVVTATGCDMSAPTVSTQIENDGHIKLP
jgi:hypothetical protein